MRVIAIANAKGGSAKTTTSVNLAGAWAEQGHRVLLIDVDPQASASEWIGPGHDDGRALGEALMDESERGVGQAGVMAERIALLPRPSRHVAHLDLIASGRWVGRAERSMASAANGRAALAGVVRALPAGRWEVVIIDCPPAVGLMTVNAMTAATDLVMPVETHGMALTGVRSLMEVVGQVRGGLNPALSPFSLIACRVDRTVLSRDVVEALRGRYGDLVAATVIRESVRAAEAPSHHLPITAYERQSAVAADYLALALELAHKLELRPYVQTT